MNDAQSLYEILDEQAQEGVVEDHPSYEVDLPEEAVPDNVCHLTAEDHAFITELCNEANRGRGTQFIQHQVYNRFWRPGRPLKIQLGRAVRVEAKSYPSGNLPAEPRSVIGKKIKAEREKRLEEARIKNLIYTLNNDNESRLRSW